MSGRLGLGFRVTCDAVPFYAWIYTILEKGADHAYIVSLTGI